MRGAEMRNLLMVCVVSLAGALVVSSHALAQTSPQPNRGGTDTLYKKLGNTGTGGAAPRRDLSGFWAGLVGAKLNEVPPLTLWGKEQFHLHKNNGEFPETALFRDAAGNLYGTTLLGGTYNSGVVFEVIP